MATEQEHVAKADSNLSFARSLDLQTQVNIDWALTALFYAALHYVEAYLAKIAAPPGTHGTHGRRDKTIVLDTQLKTISREYFDLKNFGLKARYECRPIPASSVTAEAIPALEIIQTHIRGIL